MKLALVIPGFSHAWFGDTSTALVAVAFTDAWKWSGIATLVYIAGLNAGTVVRSQGLLLVHCKSRGRGHTFSVKVWPFR